MAFLVIVKSRQMVQRGAYAPQFLRLDILKYQDSG